ncbi:MAG TPA: diaminopimelate epimerase [Fulvivirga sp.]|nr:diaminopimelate epimerase [Fulvivirga sp.]
MPTISFYKYQATGNDFILIDNRDNSVKHNESLALSLCDRKFGIGSDGLILIENHDTLDFDMVFYNPDGSKSLCGNGSRCAVNFAHKLGLINSETTFNAFDGSHEAEILNGTEVRLKMNDVHNVMLKADGMFVDTGSPHLVVYENNVIGADVYQKGKAIRYNDEFKATGININFVEIVSNNEIFVRTYERGVENETLSCGTGVTAAALASESKGLTSPIDVKTKGGRLKVEFKKDENNKFSEIYLIGPAKEVFKGTIDID